MTFLDTTLPDPCVVVLIGPAGSGKSALASTWEPTQVLCLDQYRALVSDSVGDQSATGDAAFALHRVLEARLRRGLTSVIDATSTDPKDRAAILATASRYGIPTVALIFPTPLPVCLERNAARTGDRRVPEDTVRAQHQAMVATASPAHLRHEGFDYVEFAPSIQRLGRLGALLQRVSDTRLRELGQDGSDGLGNELLPRQCFGPELARLATWKDGSDLAGGDRVVVLAVAGDYLTLAFRKDVDGEGDFGFDVLVPSPPTPTTNSTTPSAAPARPGCRSTAPPTFSRRTRATSTTTKLWCAPAAATRASSTTRPPTGRPGPTTPTGTPT
ncbi:AAA family ATPase [Streptomyces sp. NPDC006602]|uniref:AAA family ATPase n=1 Tax=Streptomyces sp. NPDC006602 TaxID=3364751 RepID=UPI0036C74DB7